MKEIMELDRAPYNQKVQDIKTGAIYILRGRCDLGEWGDIVDEQGRVIGTVYAWDQLVREL